MDILHLFHAQIILTLLKCTHLHIHHPYFMASKTNLPSLANMPSIAITWCLPLLLQGVHKFYNTILKGVEINRKRLAAPP